MFIKINMYYLLGYDGIYINKYNDIMLNSVLISVMFINALTIKMHKIVFVIILFGYLPVISAVKHHYRHFYLHVKS